MAKVHPHHFVHTIRALFFVFFFQPDASGHGWLNGALEGKMFVKKLTVWIIAVVGHTPCTFDVVYGGFHISPWQARGNSFQPSGGREGCGVVRCLVQDLGNGPSLW